MPYEKELNTSVAERKVRVVNPLAMAASTMPKATMGMKALLNGDGKRLPVDESSTAWGVMVSSSSTVA